MQVRSFDLWLTPFRIRRISGLRKVAANDVAFFVADEFHRCGNVDPGKLIFCDWNDFQFRLAGKYAVHLVAVSGTDHVASHESKAVAANVLVQFLGRDLDRIG